MGGDWWAYYELMSNNYTFLSEDTKLAMREYLRQVFSQTPVQEFHLLHLITETSIQLVQDKSKSLVTGNLTEVTKAYIDEETEALIQSAESATGSVNQLSPRCFIGFRLASLSQEKSLRSITAQLSSVVGDFVRGVNTNLVGDYVRVGSDELNRFIRAEQFTEKQISARINVERVSPDDMGYIIAHLSGQRGVPMEAYKWHMDKKKYAHEGLVRHYDILSPAGAFIDHKSRHLQIEHETGTSYVAYFTLKKVIGELSFPGSEVIFDQQGRFSFPVDVSMRVEVVPNRKAVTKIQDKKQSLEGVVDHAYQSGNNPTHSLEEAVELAKNLEYILDESKEPMFWVSYLVRVSARNFEELEHRAEEVRSWYETDYGFLLNRLWGNMEGSHYECFPGGKIACHDLKQPVDSMFISSLGFGTTDVLGDDRGFYIAHGKHKHVRIWPPLPAQSIPGAITSSLAMSFTGITGKGKSAAVKYIMYKAVMYGARVLYLDPKSESDGWLRHLPELEGEYNVVDIENRAENRGLLDPYVIMQNGDDAEQLAEDVLSYLTGINVSDGDRYPVLKRALKRVTALPDGERGLLHVIDELRGDDSEFGEKIANHLVSFTENSLAQLLFSRGDVKVHIQIDKQMNVIQTSGLDFPEEKVDISQYSAKNHLSIAMLLVLATFTKSFMRSGKGTYKIVALDEFWALSSTPQGKSLVPTLTRIGRSLNAAVVPISQSVSDLLDERLKSNIGLKFAFCPGTDKDEIRNVLEYFDLDPNDKSLQHSLRDMAPGVCLFRDLYGRVGMIKFDFVFNSVYDAFDTSTEEAADIFEENESEEEVGVEV